MDNMNTKGSVIVVLMALLFGIVGQVAATAAPSYTCFKPDPKESITIDELRSLLGSTFYTDNCLITATHGNRVFWKLESTKEKGRADAILKQYSVQQLLDWNTWTVADCTNEAYDKRRQTCEGFCSQEQAREIDPPASLFKVSGEEAFTKHNLGCYCWEIAEDMRHKCPFKQLENQLSQDKLDKIWKAFSRTRRLRFSDESFDVEGTKKKLTKYLAKKGPIEAAELHGLCSTVVGVYDAPRSYNYRVMEYYYNFIKFCRAFITGFTLDGHNKEDLKGVETD